MSTTATATPLLMVDRVPFRTHDEGNALMRAMAERDRRPSKCTARWCDGCRRYHFGQGRCEVKEVAHNVDKPRPE